MNRDCPTQRPKRWGEQECVIQAVEEQKHAQDEAEVAAMDGGGHCRDPMPRRRGFEI